MKLLEFLGRKASDELVDQIIKHTSFQEMKNNPSTNYTTLPDEVMNQKVSPFMRKGEMLMLFASIATGRPKFKQLQAKIY